MVVAAIYEGRVIYTPTSFIDILPDHYKQKPIALYNPRQAPILNQYRLIVPRTRNVLEVAQFIVLLFLFLFIMVNRNPSTFGGVELAFIIYTLGWVLDQFASILEHGESHNELGLVSKLMFERLACIYPKSLVFPRCSFLGNIWRLFGSAYTRCMYKYLRFSGPEILSVLGNHGTKYMKWRTSKLEPAQQAMDVLAMGAPVLIPRLAFNLMSENMLFVSLRAMMRDFTVLTVLACVSDSNPRKVSSSDALDFSGALLGSSFL